MAGVTRRLTRVRAIRAGHVEWDRWEAAGLSSGLSVNGWVRKSLNAAAELEEALRRQEVADADRDS